GLHLAGLHRALAAESGSPAMAPEPFSRTYQRSLYQTMRTRLEHLLRYARRHRDRIPAAFASAFDRFFKNARGLDDHFRKMTAMALGGSRIRCHGDYHLGRLLFAGDRFLLADFEGEPASSLGDRRIKRAPLRDLA